MKDIIIEEFAKNLALGWGIAFLVVLLVSNIVEYVL